MVGPVSDLRTPTRSGRTWSRWVHALEPEDLVRLVALCAPALGVDVLLDASRALAQQAAVAQQLSLTAIPADLLVHLGVGGLWFVVFALTPSGWPRRARIIAFHTGVTGYVVLTLAADVFYRRTGSLLDAATVLGALSHLDVAAAIAQRSTSSGHVAVLAVVLVYGTVGPALALRLTRAVGRAWTTRARRPTAPGDAGPRVSGPHVRTVCTALLALAVGVVFPPAVGSGAYARNNGVEMLLTTWGYAHEAAAAARSTPPPRTPATLVRSGPASPGSDAVRSPRNLVVIVLESLRWSATSLAQPDLGTTPFLAGLAAQSTVASHAYTVVPHTSKALTSIHCGIAPPLDARLTESEPGRIPTPCLPELLREQGYATAFFQSATGGFERRPDLVSNLGFGEFKASEDLPTEGFGRANYFGYEDDVLLQPSASWMRTQGEQPFMLTLLTVAGHHDYTLPESFPTRRFADDEDLNRYLNTAVYQDRFVSKVFALLDDLGIADDTMVALMGDHGEGFGEHGLRQHDNTIYDEGVHVPFIVYDPTDRRRRVVDVPVTTAATPATVLDVLGYRVDGGLSILPPLSRAEPAVVHLSCQGENRCLSRIDGSIKYIDHLGNRPDEVFDLASDPLEQHDLSGTISRRELQAMREDLLQWRTEVRTRWTTT